MNVKIFCNTLASRSGRNQIKQTGKTKTNPKNTIDTVNAIHHYWHEKMECLKCRWQRYKKSFIYQSIVKFHFSVVELSGTAYFGWAVFTVNIFFCFHSLNNVPTRLILHISWLFFGLMLHSYLSLHFVPFFVLFPVSLAVVCHCHLVMWHTEYRWQFNYYVVWHCFLSRKTNKCLGWRNGCFFDS